MACTSCGPAEKDLGGGEHDQASGSLIPANATLIVETVRTVDAKGKVLDAVISGSITQDELQRVARPYRFLDEEFLYHEEGWFEETPGGGKTVGYRVIRTPNPNPQTAPVPALLPPADKISAELLESKDETLIVQLKVAGLPEWNIPLRPEPGTLGASDYDAAVALRAAAKADRKAYFEALAAGAETAVHELGGEVLRRRWTAGWLTASVAADALPALAKRDDILRIRPAAAEVEEGWALGGGRYASRLDIDRFHDAGHDGETNNPQRHNYVGITVAVVEPNGAEDEACMLTDSQNCTISSRIAGRYDCSNPKPALDGHCDWIADVAEADEVVEAGPCMPPM